MRLRGSWRKQNSIWGRGYVNAHTHVQTFHSIQRNKKHLPLVC